MEKRSLSHTNTMPKWNKRGKLETGSVMKRRRRRSRDCLKCMSICSSIHCFERFAWCHWENVQIKRKHYTRISVEIGWKWNRFCSSHTIAIGLKRKAFVCAYHWSVKRKGFFSFSFFVWCYGYSMNIIETVFNSNNRFVRIKQWMGVERMATFFL